MHAHTHQRHRHVIHLAGSGQFVHEGAGGKYVEHAGLQRHHNAVGAFDDFAQALAVQARRGVEHHMGHALGRLGNVVGVDVPALDGAGLRRAQLQPQLGRLLHVHIPQHDRVAARGEVPGDVG